MKDGRNKARKVRDTPFSLKSERQGASFPTRDDMVRVKSVSERFYKRRNGRDEFWDWKRPCLKNHNGFVIGDSMLRCFHKTGTRREGRVIKRLQIKLGYLRNCENYECI